MFTTSANFVIATPIFGLQESCTVAVVSRTAAVGCLQLYTGAADFFPHVERLRNTIEITAVLSRDINDLSITTRLAVATALVLRQPTAT